MATTTKGALSLLRDAAGITGNRTLGQISSVGSKGATAMDAVGNISTAVGHLDSGNATSKDAALLSRAAGEVGGITGNTGLLGLAQTANKGLAAYNLAQNPTVDNAISTAAAYNPFIAKAQGLYNLVTNPTQEGVINALASFNPAALAYNQLADRVGLANVGQVVSNLEKVMDPNQFASLRDILSKNPNSSGMARTANESTDPMGTLIAILQTGAGPNDGVVGAKPPDNSTTPAAGGVTDSQGNPVTDSNGQPINGGELGHRLGMEAAGWSERDSALSDAGGFYGSDGGGCVSVEAILPDGKTAGGIGVGDTMVLADDATLEPGTGVVTYSETKPAEGWIIKTKSATLTCSSTAPIPTKDSGLVLAPDLEGETVAVLSRGAPRWEDVESITPVGPITVQHITVGDKCFWAGDTAGGFILHHNVKPAEFTGVVGRDIPSTIETYAKGGPVVGRRKR